MECDTAYRAHVALATRQLLTSQYPRDSHCRTPHGQTATYGQAKKRKASRNIHGGHDKKGRSMLKLRQADYEEIRRHGEEMYPSECCGVLLGAVEGDARVVKGAVRCRNIRTDSPNHRYEIDSVEVVRIQRDARVRGLDIIGFYHSHPDHPAHWSLTDLEEAYWLGCSYVITGIDNGKAQLTHSFVLDGSSLEDKAFVAEELVIEP
jgi:proteasome lid subunit RPN8/RPN11